MSKTTTRRLGAVLFALLVACSFAGAPAVAAAGSGDPVGDDVSDTFGSDDSDDNTSSDDGSTGDTGDSSENESTENESTDDSDGTTENKSTSDSTEDGSDESTENESADDSDDSSDDENVTDDIVEDATEPVEETVDETTDTVDDTAATAESTAGGATYRTLGIIETTAESTDDGLGLPLDAGQKTERSRTSPTGDDSRLSPRVGDSWDDAAGGSSANDGGSGAEIAAVGSLDAGGSSPLSTGGSGGQPVPAGASGGATLGLTALAAAAVIRSTPLVASSSASTAGTTASGYLSSLFDKVKPFFFPLRYSRYDDSDPLEHDARERVYEIVNETPGSYLSEVSEQAGLPLSTTRHHMKVLEREELVSGAKLRGKRRFYPAYAEGIELAAALNDESTASIIDALARLGAASVSDLADDLGRDPSTISHHLQRLEEDEIITREREGRAVMNKLSPEARTALGPETTPRPGEAAEALAD